MKDFIQVMTTTENREDAKRVARKVVEERLVACAQVIGPISSVYWWKDKIEEENEWLCLMKSRRDLYTQLEETIKQIHPYEEPEILVVPFTGGSQSYLDWMDQQIRS